MVYLWNYKKDEDDEEEHNIINKEISISIGPYNIKNGSS